MHIKLNQQEVLVSENSLGLVSLMKTRGLYLEGGIAVAVNSEILPRQSWENYQLQDNDNILIITATQGG